MEDEDTGSRLPFAICLEDSNVSVNIPRTMLSELTTRNDRSIYCAQNPVSKTLPENYTSLRCRRKENRINVQEKMANSIVHHYSSHIWVYMKHFTHSDLLCPHHSSRVGTVSYLVRQIKLRYIETEFSVTCFTSLFYTASLMKIIY